MNPSSAPAPTRNPWHGRARQALHHSLRLRLVALFVLLALALTLAFVLGMQRAFAVGWRDAARPLLADYVDRLAADLGSPPDPVRAQALVQRLPLSVRIHGPQVNWESHPRSSYAEWEHSADSQTEARLLSRHSADGHRIDFGLSVQAWQNRPRRIGWITLTVLLTLTAVAYATVRRLLRPLDDIRAGVQRFGRGEFDAPIAVLHPNRPDELGDLAATINSMAHELHQMLEAKRGLLLAISHELRSPLTRARLNTELLPESADVAPAREALLRDLALMRDLVTDLLESERLASRHAALQREATDLAALVREGVAELALRTPAAGTVALHLADDVPLLLLDRARLRLLLRNLLDNALRHSAATATAPQIVLARTPEGIVLSVRDHGPGVDPTQLAQLTEPFFRPDAARGRASGGIGLGLYLCKRVAQAHGGQLTLRNAGPGLLVALQLPLPN